MLDSEVARMAMNEHGGIENLLQLANEIAAALEPLARRSTDTEGLRLRLAQAHSLGLIDQLSEMAHEGAMHEGAMRELALRSIDTSLADVKSA